MASTTSASDPPASARMAPRLNRSPRGSVRRYQGWLAPNSSAEAPAKLLSGRRELYAQEQRRNRRRGGNEESSRAGALPGMTLPSPLMPRLRCWKPTRPRCPASSETRADPIAAAVLAQHHGPSQLQRQGAAPASRAAAARERIGSPEDGGAAPRLGDGAVDAHRHRHVGDVSAGRQPVPHDEGRGRGVVGDHVAQGEAGSSRSGCR